MKCLPRLPKISRVFLLTMALWLSALTGAFGQERGFVPGKIILYCKPGTPQADVDQLVQLVNAETTRPLLLKDCYQLILPQDKRNDMDTLSAVATLKADPRVRYVSAERVYVRDQGGTPITMEPNDPRYRSGEQWSLPMIKMPQAWTLQKGSANTNIAVMDSGFAPTHEDFRNRIHPGSFDAADNDNDVTADGTGGGFDHGTSVSSTAMSNTDNAIGMAGVCWENVRCVGIKIQKVNTGNLDGAAIISGLTYVADNAGRLNIKVMNLSFGGAADQGIDPNDPEYVAVKSCHDAGINVVVSAGNSNQDNTRRMPTGIPFVITVAAVGPSGQKASYSNFGKVDIAGPGGDAGATGVQADGILVHTQPTATATNTYAFVDGTSFSAPITAGVMGLLRSVDGVTRDQAAQALFQTANRTGLNLTTLPDRVYGYGLVDAYAALLRVSVRAIIIDPVGIDGQGNTTDPSGIAPPTQTFRPKIRLEISNVPLANLSVRIDDDPPLSQDFLNSSAVTITGNATGPNPRYTLEFRRSFAATSPFQHRITVTATNPASGVSASDTRIFTLTPFTIQPGLSFVSIPFYESAADSPSGQVRPATEVLGSDIQLYRYNPVPGPTPYVTYSNTAPTNADPKLYRPLAEAFLPNEPNIPRLEGGNPNTDTRPVGLAYFIRTNSALPVVTYGVNYTQQAFRIPLHEGWNMVGNPFNFRVSFNAISVETPSGERIPIDAAASRNLLLPFIYRFVDNEYQFNVLPEGVLAPWEGHWIFVPAKNPRNPSTATVLTLVVPPAAVQVGGIGRSASQSTLTSVKNSTVRLTTRSSSSANNWTLQLIAQTQNLKDGYNFVGVSTRATDGDDQTKVPKPPVPSPYVSVGITRASTPGVLYAQDLRSPGRLKTWDVVVSTDQPNSEVNLTWPNAASVSRAYRLTLTDKKTGQAIDLRNQSSYRFKSGAAPETREFVLTARQTALRGRAILSNVTVNQTRAGGGRSNPLYEVLFRTSTNVRVEGRIMGFNGRMVTEIPGGRAVEEGENRLVWNGRDKEGRTIAGGTYVLQLTAVTDDGEVTRVATPLIITGR